MQSKIQTKKLASREEELPQNLEELQTIQKEENAKK